MAEHKLIYYPEDANTWICDCGEEFGTKGEAEAHTIAQDTPENRMLNCISQHHHQPQPVEQVNSWDSKYKVMGSFPDRTRVTKFFCPNCKWITEVPDEEEL